MLKWALICAIIAVVAAALGFGGLAGAAAGIAKFLFFAFLALLSPIPPPELFRALDLEGAVAAAKIERKYVLAVFTSAGSSDSKKLDMTTWTETSFAFRSRLTNSLRCAGHSS